MSEPVRVWSEDIPLPTYLPELPDRNPMFLERRVYQGSSGRIYPLPFTDRIRVQPVVRNWRGIWLENQYLRVLILPELGGRIHAAQDKINGYDFIYRQPVIKPALVGLAGPWISGGIELNWPQHHRPATFLPVQVAIEAGVDGSQTVWCSDHDPLTRMRGTHGVCLYPDRAFLELRVRACNRTLHSQTFLWWANVAAEVHEGYQSFFPEDVRFVADHARRAMVSFPLATGSYYGVDYGKRAREGVPSAEMPANYVPPVGTPRTTHGLVYSPNDLSFYANIPVPTSYMVVDSRGDFFGGYDHRAGAGIVHVADHRKAPGKKQWTWGNHAFGYAWDRNLTDPRSNGEYPPYIELMAGVFTDNQPDFSFLAPGETRVWSQYWYPIREIGPVAQANTAAAVSFQWSGRTARIGVHVTAPIAGAVIRLEIGARTRRWRADLTPERPWFGKYPVAAQPDLKRSVIVSIESAEGREILRYARTAPASAAMPRPATEPACPEAIRSADALYHTGLHLEQYRHATRSPIPYWSEALRRDPGDYRCNTMMGQWHLRRGEFDRAVRHLTLAIDRATERNANPRDGEAHYLLGISLRHLGRHDEAANAMAKAAWNRAWSVPANFALAELACVRQAWEEAETSLQTVLEQDANHEQARTLLGLVWMRSGRWHLAEPFLSETLRRDPLHTGARQLLGQALDVDAQVRLDLAHDWARAGFIGEAIAIVEKGVESASGRGGDLPNQSWGAGPMVAYTLGWLWERRGDGARARQWRACGRTMSPDYCFPARVEEIEVLTQALAADPTDPRAAYYLGNLYYDRRRYDEAIRCWRRSASLDPGLATVWRNLGIAHFNIRHRPTEARRAYDRSIRVDPTDARLWYERDQLWRRLGVDPRRRLRLLEKHSDMVLRRDDLSVELCALYNQTGSYDRARELLAARRFQPWEGGEGMVLWQFVRAELGLGRERLRLGDLPGARAHFESALQPPENLGEARHLLSNDSQVHYWCGVACEQMGLGTEARRHWEKAAAFMGDFQEMSRRPYSEMSFYSAMSLRRLRRQRQAAQWLRGLLEYSRRLERAPAVIDYFATSLPAMLLFEDDLKVRNRTTALFLRAQAYRGLGNRTRARSLLRRVLAQDPSHAWAADLVSEEASVTDF
ncbi:MAG: DUF5107 domain-containing protein [Verrucomicrobiales bacterium]|nr:DUF5107 domain-containing protein [Verrucomicrobiales bacterium]